MRLAFRHGWALSALCLSVLSGCGDDGGEGEAAGSCEAVAPCGGDPTGSWAIEEGCAGSVATLVEGSDCTPVLRSRDVTTRGNADFKTDKTYAMTSTLNGTVTVDYPPACFTSNGTTTTCEEYNALLQESAAQNGSSFASEECTAVGEDCRCKLTYKDTTVTLTGTWSVAGAALTLESEAGQSDAAGFCVEGSTFILGLSDQRAAGDAGTARIESYLRLTRK